MEPVWHTISISHAVQFEKKATESNHDWTKQAVRWQPSQKLPGEPETAIIVQDGLGRLSKGVQRMQAGLSDW